MTQRPSYLRTAVKLTLVVSALVVATLFVGRGAQPAHASHTELIFSYSNAAPIPTSTIVLYPGLTDLEVYVWAKDVDNSTGASAWQLHLFYGSGLFDIESFLSYTTWLGSSGRSASCPVPAEILPTEAHLGCNTVGNVPPYGATGSGLLARVLISALPTAQAPAATLLDASNSFLINTPLDPDDYGEIPITIQSPSVVLLRCADFNYDGSVTLADDILSVILRWQMTPAHPQWDAVYDLDQNNQVDLAGDILGTILQYQRQCTQGA